MTLLGNPVVRPYWKLRGTLYSEDDIVLYGTRVVVPAAFRRCVLARLHDSHRSAKVTRRQAWQVVYYWPGTDSDIVNIVYACEPCQVL